MADNVGITTGTDADIAADEIASAYYQRIKVGWGADGTWVTASADQGNANTGTLRVAIADDDTNLAAIKTAVETIDNAISGSEMQVDLVSANVTNAGTFAVQVDGDALTALQLIDDAVAAEGAALGKGILLQGDDGTDRQNIAVDTSGNVQVDIVSSATISVNDGAGSITVDDGSSSLTVDGTIAATQSGSWSVNQGGSWTVTADLGATDNAVLDTIASAVHAEDAAHNTGDAGVQALAVRTDTAPSAIAGTSGDYSPLQVDNWGALYVRLVGDTGGLATQTINTGADALANTYNQLVTAGFAHGFNGTTWDRLRSDTTYGLDTDVTRVADQYDDYETVAASTDATLGATGATGDYLAGVLIIPGTTSPGSVDIGDGSTDTEIFAGGTSSVATLHPFYVPIGATSVSGAWSIITGSNVTAIGFGRFT